MTSLAWPFSRLGYSLSHILLLLCAAQLVQGGTQDINIDDDSPMITYSGDFGTPLVPLAYGGKHKNSDGPASTATLVFTGTGIQYLSPLWPYAVNSGITLDSFPKVDVNLTDPSASPTDGGSPSSMSKVRWSRTGLSNTSHTLVISRASKAGLYVIVDGFVITTATADDAPDSVTKAATTASSSPTSASTQVPSTKSSVLPIAIGAAVGGLALFAAILLGIFCYKRRQRRQRMYRDTHEKSVFDPPPFTPFAPGMAQHHSSSSSFGDVAQRPGIRPIHPMYSSNSLQSPPVSQYGGTALRSTVGGPYDSRYTDTSYSTNNSGQNLLPPGVDERYSVVTTSAGGACLGAHGGGLAYDGSSVAGYGVGDQRMVNPYSAAGGYSQFGGSGSGAGSSSATGLTMPLGLGLASGSQGRSGAGAGADVVQDEKAFVRNQKEFQASQDREEVVVAPPAYTH